MKNILKPAVFALIFAFGFGAFSTASAAKATVSVKSVSARPLNQAAVYGVNEKVISWTSANYPKNVGVNVNLLRKVSSSPASYKLVRQIAQNAANTGSIAWLPRNTEKGSDLYIEVTCAQAHKISDGCQINASPIKAI